MSRKPPSARERVTTSEAATLLGFFFRRFREIGESERARWEKAYLKSALRFHGVTSPQIARAVRDFTAAYGRLSRQQVHDLVDAAFATDWFDIRSAALAVLTRHQKQLDGSDLPWLVGLVRQSTTWAHVDWISPKMIGAVLAREPALIGPRLREWAQDPNFWVRRAALLAQLDSLRRGGGDFDAFAAIAAPMLTEKEFFIRKAIGWVLRDVSKKRPDLPFAFLRSHRARVSGLTLREGARYLPPEQRAELGLPPSKTPASRRG